LSVATAPETLPVLRRFVLCSLRCLEVQSEYRYSVYEGR